MINIGREFIYHIHFLSVKKNSEKKRMMDAFRGQRLLGVFSTKYLTESTKGFKGVMVVYRRN